MKNIYNKIFLILKLLVVLFILLNTTDTFAQKSIDDNDLAYEWTDSPDKIPSSFIVDEINKSLAISNEHIPISWNAMAGTSMTVTPNVTTICAGGTVNITWNWNLGDGHPGTAEYSTDNVNWYLMNAGTLATISNGVAKSITPAGTTTYYGRVRSTTNPVGDLYSNSCTITVVADPTVGTQPTSPVSICTGGTSGNMTAAGSGGTGTFSYQWQYNNGGTWGSVSNGSPAGSIYTGGTSGTMSVAGISSANNYQYHCIISQTGSGCGQLTTNTVTVSVAADPTAPSLNVATPASGSTVCVGGKVSATFNAGSGGTGCVDEYQYTTNGGGTWAAYTPGNNITASTTGTNAIQIQTRRPCTGTGCDGAGETWDTKAQWTVVGDPTAPTNTATPAASSTVCVGQALSITASGSTGGTGTCTYQYAIDPGTGTFGAWGSTNSVTPSSVGNGTYRIKSRKYCDGGGCDSPLNETITSWTVAADPTAPSLNTATPASTSTVCVGKTVKATFYAGSGGTGCGADEYQYTTNSGGSWSAYTPGSDITASATGANAIQIQTRRVCSGNGCDGAGETWATKAQWTVVADPNLSAPTNAAICFGGSATFTSNLTGGMGTQNPVWQYSPNGSSGWIPVVSGTPPNASYANTGTATLGISGNIAVNSYYYRRVLSATSEGCDAVSSTATLTVVADPSFAAHPSGFSECQGDNQQLSVTGSNGTPSLWYQWYSNTVNNNTTGTPIDGATSSTYIPPSISTGTLYYYCVVGATGSGCNNATSNTATVTINAVPTANFTPNPITEICYGSSTTLTANVSPGGGSYQWMLNGSNTGSNSSLYSATLPGNYKVQYTANGCSKTSSTAYLSVQSPVYTLTQAGSSTISLSNGDYVWSGNTSQAWDVATNWLLFNGSENYFNAASSVPTINDNIYIRGNDVACPSNISTVKENQTAYCKNINIETSLAMENGSTLNVSGNWNNSGTFTSGSGTQKVVFNGNSNQIIASGGSKFNNLTLNNAHGIIMTSDLTVGNVLNMTSGNIETGVNTLELGTSASSTGSLSYTDGFVLGKMRRWFSNTTNSGNASGLFPLGFGSDNRHLLVEYTGASSGGSLTTFFNENAMEWPIQWMDIANVPIIPATGPCPTFIILTLSDEGYWDVTPNGMTGGQYNISLTGGGIQTINNLCNLTALKREGGGEWYEDGDHVQPTGSTSTPVVKRVGASGWSNWGMGGGAYNPLPINLLSFNAVCQNKEVTINWSTATETNNDYFTIERSIDAQKWDVLTQVEGAGNSNAIKYYTIRDDNPYDGISYYRLKQTDYNGQYEYFNPVSVLCDSEESTPIISYYPNPFTSEVVIDIHNLSVTKASLVIYDLLGNKVYENIFSMDEEINKKFTIDLNRLPVGVYIASFVTDEYSNTSRIVKNY